jgi:hypothetical protein
VNIATNTAPIDIAAGRALVDATRGLAHDATPHESNGHSQSCKCEECVAAWGRGASVSSARDALPAKALLLTDAHAAALDEVEQLRARVTKLEAVVEALPKCHSCAKRPAPLAEQEMDGTGGYTCDVCAPIVRAEWEQHRVAAEHECGFTVDPLMRLTELPYAAALRALEKT